MTQQNGNTMASIEREDGTLIEAHITLSGWHKPARRHGDPHRCYDAESEVSITSITLHRYDIEGNLTEVREVDYGDLDEDVRIAVDEAVKNAEMEPVNPHDYV